MYETAEETVQRLEETGVRGAVRDGGGDEAGVEARGEIQAVGETAPLAYFLEYGS